MPRLLPLLLALVAAGACAHVKNDQAVCPEYREMRCVGDARCSYDRSRGCKVCQCQDMDADPMPLSSPDDPSQPPVTED